MATRGWHSVYPLIAFNDPREVFAAQPTFFCCEVLFLFLAAIGIRDALRRPRGLLTFVACLIGGASVELVTILHQEVGNFYHSQATIMLFGRREPLYMLLGCYGWIAHAAMMLSHKFGGTLMQQACLGGLLGAESWALLDMVGARLLWWTWHNSEPLYADREGGVPVASSFWILASMASLPITLHYCCPSSNALWGLVAGPLATLGLMHVPFMLIFHPLSTFLKFHAAHSLWLFRLLCFAPLAPRVLAAWTTPKTKKKAPASRSHGAVFAHCTTFVVAIVLLAALGDPTAERRTSFSQPCIRSRGHKVGTGCPQTESCFWGGFARRAHVCTADSIPAHDLYRVCDARCDAAKEPLETYTTCGVAVEGFEWYLLVLAHAAAVMGLAYLPFVAPADSATKVR